MITQGWDKLRKDKAKVSRVLKEAGLSPALVQLRWASLTKSDRAKIGRVAKGKGWHEAQIPIVTSKGIKKKAPVHRKVAIKKSFKSTLRKPLRKAKRSRITHEKEYTETETRKDEAVEERKTDTPEERPVTTLEPTTSHELRPTELLGQDLIKSIFSMEQRQNPEKYYFAESGDRITIHARPIGDDVYRSVLDRINELPSPMVTMHLTKNQMEEARNWLDSKGEPLFAEGVQIQEPELTEQAINDRFDKLNLKIGDILIHKKYNLPYKYLGLKTVDGQYRYELEGISSGQIKLYDKYKLVLDFINSETAHEPEQPESVKETIKQEGDELMPDDLYRDEDGKVKIKSGIFKGKTAKRCNECFRGLTRGVCGEHGRIAPDDQLDLREIGKEPRVTKRAQEEYEHLMARANEAGYKTFADYYNSIPAEPSSFKEYAWLGVGLEKIFATGNEDTPTIKYLKKELQHRHDAQSTTPIPLQHDTNAGTQEAIDFARTSPVPIDIIFSKIKIRLEYTQDNGIPTNLDIKIFDNMGEMLHHYGSYGLKLTVDELFEIKNSAEKEQMEAVAEKTKKEQEEIERQKVKETYYLRLPDGTKERAEGAYPFNYEGIDMFIHTVEDAGGDKEWRVSEKRTGILLAKGHNSPDAEFNAAKVIRDKGADVIKEKLAKVK